jgi:hypothetical protein
VSRARSETDDPTRAPAEGAPQETPIKVYGSAISYYTGKLEGYLRYKEIPYEFVPYGPAAQLRVRRRTGASQKPRARFVHF